jgi:hypothetical protein
MLCTYYLDVMSQWCMFADRAVAKLIEKYGDAVAFDYRIAPVKDGQPLGYTRRRYGGCTIVVNRSAGFTQTNPGSKTS